MILLDEVGEECADSSRIVVHHDAQLCVSKMYTPEETGCGAYGAFGFLEISRERNVCVRGLLVKDRLVVLETVPSEPPPKGRPKKGWPFKYICIFKY